MGSFVVLTPSRGLVHSRMLEAVLSNVEQAVGAGHEYRGWRLSHSLPIPASHESVTSAGMASGAEAFWYVEEDNVPPPGALLALMALQTPVAALDYPVGESPTSGCILHRIGAPLLVGLGCTLVNRRVFEALERPWFRTDVAYQMRGNALVELDHGYEYGGLDVSFSVRVAEAGFALGEVAGMVCGHALLRTWGQQQTNAGFHTIEIRQSIERTV